MTDASSHVHASHITHHMSHVAIYTSYKYTSHVTASSHNPNTQQRCSSSVTTASNSSSKQQRQQATAAASNSGSKQQQQQATAAASNSSSKQQQQQATAAASNSSYSCKQQQQLQAAGISSAFTVTCHSSQSVNQVSCQLATLSLELVISQLTHQQQPQLLQQQQGVATQLKIAKCKVQMNWLFWVHRERLFGKQKR